MPGIEGRDNPAAATKASEQERAAQRWFGEQSFPTMPVMMLRGLIGRCPSCGRAPLFDGFLRLANSCPVCAAPLGMVRADDAPPYFTIFITAHLIIALVVVSGQRTNLPVWGMIAGFLPLTVVIAMLLMRPIKGATAAVALRLGLLGAR